MTILIFTILYILSVFLARYFNKLLYKIAPQEGIKPWCWFVPIIGLVTFIAVYTIHLIMKGSTKTNWFNGKYWILLIIITLSSCSIKNTSKYIITDSNNHKYYTDSIGKWDNCAVFNELNKEKQITRKTTICGNWSYKINK